jgi:hypothetical protein
LPVRIAAKLARLCRKKLVLSFPPVIGVLQKLRRRSAVAVCSARDPGLYKTRSAQVDPAQRLEWDGAARMKEDDPDQHTLEAALATVRGIAATLRAAADGKVALGAEILRDTADVLDALADDPPPP